MISPYQPDLFTGDLPFSCLCNGILKNEKVVFSFYMVLYAEEMQLLRQRLNADCKMLILMTIRQYAPDFFGKKWNLMTGPIQHLSYFMTLLSCHFVSSDCNV